MNYDLLTIGDVCIDEYLKVDDAQVICDIDKKQCKICFDYSGKIPVKKFSAGIAGNSSNVAVGCARLSLACAIYTETGDDANADKFITEYKKLDINTEFFMRNSGRPTNVHQIIVYEGERPILAYHEHFDYKMKNWGNPKWLYYTSLPQNFAGFQTQLVTFLKKNPQIGVAFNPGTYHLKADIAALSNILEVTHILFVNKEEAKKLGAKGGILETHMKLQQLGPKLTVLTDGANGSSVYDGKELVELGILAGDIKVVDKTGAGDAHSSGFLAAIFYGKSLPEALKWGTINAAGIVENVGSINGLKTREEMESAVKAAEFHHS